MIRVARGGKVTVGSFCADESAQIDILVGELSRLNHAPCSDQRQSSPQIFAAIDSGDSRRWNNGW
jgi:hypothetical protein